MQLPPKNHPRSIMGPQFSSFFPSAPSTSRLEAPKEIQRAYDFESTRTEPIVDEEVNTEPGLGLDRLTGYELSRDRKKLRSSIWTYGWRLINDEDQEHWVCRKCHTGPLKPKKPNGHLFKTTAQTSGPIYHLRNLHGIVSSGATPGRAYGASTTPFGSRQPSITGFTSSSTGARNSDTPFDYDAFKGLLLRLFTTRPISLALVEDEAFRSLLIYCQPALSDCTPSRRILRLKVTCSQLPPRSICPLTCGRPQAVGYHSLAWWHIILMPASIHVQSYWHCHGCKARTRLLTYLNN